MDFYMYHGRTDPTGPPQAIVRAGDKVEYVDIDDWGFEGPRLKGVIGFHCTYGTSGHWNLWFKSDRAADEAHWLTGWERWDDRALTARFSSDGSLLRINDPAYPRAHYFGDWGIK